MLWGFAGMCGILGIALGWEEYSDRGRDDRPRYNVNHAKLLIYCWFAGIIASGTETWTGTALVFLCSVGACQVSKQITLCVLPLFPKVVIPEFRAKAADIWTKKHMTVIGMLLIVTLGAVGLMMDQGRVPYAFVGASSVVAKDSADAYTELSPVAAAATTSDSTNKTAAKVGALIWPGANLDLPLAENDSASFEPFDPEDFKRRVAEISRIEAEKKARDAAAMVAAWQGARIIAESQAVREGVAAEVEAAVVEGMTNSIKVPE